MGASVAACCFQRTEQACSFLRVLEGAQAQTSLAYEHRTGSRRLAKDCRLAQLSLSFLQTSKSLQSSCTLPPKTSPKACPSAVAAVQLVPILQCVLGAPTAAVLDPAWRTWQQQQACRCLLRPQHSCWTSRASLPLRSLTPRWVSAAVCASTPCWVCVCCMQQHAHPAHLLGAVLVSWWSANLLWGSTKAKNVTRS